MWIFIIQLFFLQTSRSGSDTSLTNVVHKLYPLIMEVENIHGTLEKIY